MIASTESTGEYGNAEDEILRVLRSMCYIVASTQYYVTSAMSTEKRADHSLRDEQICCSPLSFLCAVAPRFSVGPRRVA